MNVAMVYLMLGQGGQGGGGFQFVFLGLMILVFWMFMIRPQAKKAKLQKQFLVNLQKGDKVITIAAKTKFGSMVIKLLPQRSSLP